MPIAPAEFPPPVEPAQEFVSEPTDPVEDRIEVGVAIVGGGIANTFMLAAGLKIGKSLAEADLLDDAADEIGPGEDADEV